MENSQLELEPLKFENCNRILKVFTEEAPSDVTLSLWEAQFSRKQIVGVSDRIAKGLW